MFINQADLDFAQQRMKESEAHAERMRLSKHLRSEQMPLWVRVLRTALDRSNWALVQKSELAPMMTGNTPLRRGSVEYEVC